MIATLIEELLRTRAADAGQVEHALERALAGELDEIQVSGLLVALRACATTPELLAGAARAVRRQALPLKCDVEPLVDTAGTGGDGSGTFNISTAAALTAAACGAFVAKHGNRGVSSKSGSADVLEELGFPLDLGPEAATRALQRSSFCFLFAPHYHPSMKRVAPVRRSLGIRTLFNLLGPLVNPAGAAHQVLGVSSAELALPMAEAARILGVRRALIVHCDGMDELGLHAPTEGFLVLDGSLEPFHCDPRALGLGFAEPRALVASDAADSAAILRRCFAGERGPCADVVALNAAAALFACGLAPDMTEGVARAQQAIRSGAVAATTARAREAAIAAREGGIA